MSEKKSMTAWLREEHPELGDAYADALLAADRRYETSRPGYGRSGEALFRSGLDDSGYAAYLAGVAYATRQSEKSEAQKTLRRDAGKGYAAYLTQKEKERQTAMANVTGKLLQYGITDSDAAYTLALQYGLGTADARRTAESAAGLHASGDLRRTVLRNLVSLGMRAEYGMQYAMACGLSEEEADEIARVAETSYRAKDLGYSQFVGAADFMEKYYQ